MSNDLHFAEETITGNVNASNNISGNLPAKDQLYFLKWIFLEHKCL